MHFYRKSSLTYSAMIFVCELGSLSGEEADLGLNIMSSRHSTANGGLCALGKRFTIDIFRNETWYVSIISGDVLLAHLMLVATDPGRGVLAAVTEYVLERLVLWGHALKRCLIVKAHSG